MLGLKLREEFAGKRLKGTAIELVNERSTGATQVPARQFLEITYPTSDVLKSLEALGAEHGRPLVLLGERGLGKSHLLAVLYHALTDLGSTRLWLDDWATRLAMPKIASLPLPRGVLVIGESLHRQRHKYLWDLLFDCHPDGKLFRGRWEGMGGKKTHVPPDILLLDLLREKPVALLLDEFQTWYDGLINTDEEPQKSWAFNFIQTLSDIAKNHPGLLTLVVSVRNGTTDAYQQIHRVNPVVTDFKGKNADRDRQQLLLHRLFENRRQINTSAIERITAVPLSEYFRLGRIPGPEHARLKQAYIEAWPFAPHLLQLLEDHVLVATDAQETRDLIRILADLFKNRGDVSPVLTPADFRIDDESSAIASLLDSVSNQHHAQLREKAQRNLQAVQDALGQGVSATPHLPEIISSLWLRSLTVDGKAGADPATLQIDITRDSPIDDNAFQVELDTILSNSFNIHRDGARLLFKPDENPHAKVMAYARSDHLFTDGSDHAQLAREVRYVLGGADDVAKAIRVIVLPLDWTTDPWSALEETERPDRWDDRLPVLVLPEEPQSLNETLGRWLIDHLQQRRNICRFVLPRHGSTNLYLDRDLIVMARAILKADEWRSQGLDYTKLHEKFERDIRDPIKYRFDRFAILSRWNFTDPSRCTFLVENLKKLGSAIPEAIEEALRQDLFALEDFESLVMEAARGNESVGKLFRELQEPRPNASPCIPWLGETIMKEKLLGICAAGRISINVRGIEHLQAAAGEGADAAWQRMRGRLGSGRHLDDTYVLLPQAIPETQSVGSSLEGSTGAPPTADGSLPPTPAQPQTPPAVSPVSQIFAAPTEHPRIPLSAPATSPLNLIGRVESWGVGPGSALHDVTLKLANATGAQLLKLLRGLPDGLTYELNVEKEKDQ